MAKLLRQAASRDLAPEYVRKLLAVFGDETKTFSTTCDRDWENGSTYAGLLQTLEQNMQILALLQEQE
jgi:hypothetical protein